MDISSKTAVFKNGVLMKKYVLIIFAVLTLWYIYEISFTEKIWEKKLNTLLKHEPRKTHITDYIDALGKPNNTYDPRIPDSEHYEICFDDCLDWEQGHVTCISYKFLRFPDLGLYEGNFEIEFFSYKQICFLDEVLYSYP